MPHLLCSLDMRYPVCALEQAQLSLMRQHFDRAAQYILLLQIDEGRGLVTPPGKQQFFA